MPTHHPVQHSHGASTRFGRARAVVHLAGHLPATLTAFWSSELNRQAIDLVAPQPGEVVVDVGAGMGAGALVAVPRVAPHGTVIALDPSPVMRAFMRLRRLSPRVEHLDIRAGSAESLPVDGATVDAIYAVNAAHHFADLTLFVAEVARSLRPGGRLVLVEEDLSHPDHPFSVLNATPGDDRPHRRPHAVDGDQLASLLTGAGLKSATSTYRTVGATPATVIVATQPR